MSGKRKKIIVAILVFCCLIAGGFAFMYWYAGHQYKKGSICVTYFNGSVLGLTEASPVTYKGVPVGRVEQIGIAPDVNQIEVVFRLYRDFDLDNKMVTQLEPLGFYGALVLGLDDMKQDEILVTPNPGTPVRHFVILSRPPNFPTMGDLYDLIRKMDEVLEQMKINLAE